MLFFRNVRLSTLLPGERPKRKMIMPPSGAMFAQQHVDEVVAKHKAMLESQYSQYKWSVVPLGGHSFNFVARP